MHRSFHMLQLCRDLFYIQNKTLSHAPMYDRSLGIFFRPYHKNTRVASRRSFFVVTYLSWRCFPISKDSLRINEEIHIREVRVTSATGKQLGIMATRDALQLAEEQHVWDWRWGPWVEAPWRPLGAGGRCSRPGQTVACSSHDPSRP